MNYKTSNPEENEKIVSEFLEKLRPKEDGATILGLYGDLGSGKTTFTKSLAKVLGVEAVVSSPTFVIEKIYSLENKPFKHLIHIDAYRIEKSEEMLRLGWQKIVSDKESLIVIEWPEKISDILGDHIKVKFDHVSENEREIEIDL